VSVKHTYRKVGEYFRAIVYSNYTIVSKAGQIAASINEKHCIGDIMFLSESMEECRRGTDPAAAVNVGF
jgi:hypothetical protein